MNEKTEDQEDLEAARAALEEAKEKGTVSLDDLLSGIQEENVHPGVSTGRAEDISPIAPGDFKSDLIERLKHKDYAGDYLRESLDEGREAFLLAAKDVAAAMGWEVWGVILPAGEDGE